MTRVAVVVSHPIQHFCPQYESWSKLADVELRVFFASKHGLKPYQDRNFGKTIQWANLSMDFPHEFLEGADERPLGTSIDCASLERTLDAFNPEVLLVYGYAQKLQRRAIRWGTSRTAVVGMIADSELRTARAFHKRVTKAAIVPTILRRIAFFLTVGDANEAYYRRYGVSDHRMVRNFFPIDRRAFDSVLERKDEARARVREELGLSAGDKVVLNVGKFVPWKRQIDLVELSNSLSATRSDVTVLLAGSGKEEGNLKEAARRTEPGGVIFAGFVQPSQLIEFYMAADIYVHASDHEPHSLAVSEAIYSGLPVVVSDRCGSYGPTDDVQTGKNGLVYRCGDVPDLRAKVTALVDDAPLHASMCQASKQMGAIHQNLAHGEGLLHALRCVRSVGF